MKKILSMLVFALTIFGTFGIVNAAESGIKIDKSHFPNTYFRYYVGMEWDENSDGYLSENERNAVTAIDVGEYSVYRMEYEFPMVTTMKGIEYFPNLIELDCSNAKLEKLDVSKNKKLQVLKCYGNAISKLNLKNNKHLVTLSCSDNYLSELDLSHNKKLKILNCGENKGIRIKGRKNIKSLESLTISDADLTTLNVGIFRNLIRLQCDNNDLTKLNLKRNKKLKELYCYSNNIKRLNLSKNRNLRLLSCSDNQLSTINLSKNRKLQYLYCQRNRLITGNIHLGNLQLEENDVSPQKATIKAVKMKKGYLIPLKGVNRTNVIRKISKGKIHRKGIMVKGKRLPKEITYQYNMFTDGDKNTKVKIRIKK